MGIRIAATALAIGGAFAAAAAPASAAPVPAWDCEASAFCIYRDADGNGPHLDMEDGASDLSKIGNGDLNDHVFSVRNIEGANWCLYASSGYRDELRVIPDGFQGNLTPDVAGQVSSVREC